jgi:hypothetical protein
MPVETSARQLPCAHCGEPIPLALARFFPARKYPIVCPTCGRSCWLPWNAVVIGLVALLFLALVSLTLLKAFGLTEADTIPSILVLGLTFFLLALLSTNLACRICRAQVERLDP